MSRPQLLLLWGNSEGGIPRKIQLKVKKEKFFISELPPVSI